DQTDHATLTHRQLRNVLPQILESEPTFGDASTVANQQVVDELNIDDIAADLFRAHVVDPQILCDAKHPAVQPCARFPLIQVGQSPHIGFLDQILTGIQTACP